MLELLPDINKKYLRREYFLRLVVVILSFSFAAGIMLVVSLSPSYFLSVAKEKIINQEFENARKSNNAAGDEGLQAAVKNSKEMIALLKPEGGVSLIKDLILKIISKKNSGVAIDGISINGSKDGQYQIFIKGMSKNRGFLKSFADSLGAEKEFSAVDLPISNFAKIADIDFNIALKTAI
ncbi:MAG: hypothetical protein KGJ58_04285 [Patescibacteria group bacterium]|nr:hypothetical protein [Patescibacteria group bacterium]MDE1988506.1 hypothetical protein [Patescibacteria group bacterium]MDE2218636.1 hypothetical protein [Patescibacteria group bacterium]